MDKFVDLLMLSAGPPEGWFVPKPPFHIGNTRIKGGPSQYPGEAAALAFFRVPRIMTTYVDPIIGEFSSTR